MTDWDALLLKIPPMMISFTPRRDSQTAVVYMQMDLWETVQEGMESLRYKRKDLDMEFLDDDIIRTLMQPLTIQNLRTQRYNNFDFRIFDYQTDNNGKSEILFNYTTAMTLKNGYLHMFQLSSPSSLPQYIQDFEELLKSVIFIK